MQITPPQISRQPNWNSSQLCWAFKAGTTTRGTDLRAQLPLAMDKPCAECIWSAVLWRGRKHPKIPNMEAHPKLCCWNPATKVWKLHPWGPKLHHPLPGSLQPWSESKLTQLSAWLPSSISKPGVTPTWPLLATDNEEPPLLHQLSIVFQTKPSASPCWCNYPSVGERVHCGLYIQFLRKALPHRKHRCPGSDCDNTSNHTGAACFMWTHFNDMVWSCITQILAKTTCCVKCQKSAGLFGILETTGLILTAKTHLSGTVQVPISTSQTVEVTSCNISQLLMNDPEYTNLLSELQ